MRTIGARDKKKRKQRSDKKSRHSKSSGNFQPYVSKRLDKNAKIKLWVWERRIMSHEGYMRFRASFRPKVRRVITRFVGRPFLVDPQMLATDESICQLFIDVVGYDGFFLGMMPTHSKNSYRCSFKKKFSVKIDEAEEGLRAKVTWSVPLAHYWFRRR